MLHEHYYLIEETIISSKRKPMLYGLNNIVKYPYPLKNIHPAHCYTNKEKAEIAVSAISNKYTYKSYHDVEWNVVEVPKDCMIQCADEEELEEYKEIRKKRRRLEKSPTGKLIRHRRGMYEEEYCRGLMRRYLCELSDRECLDAGMMVVPARIGKSFRNNPFYIELCRRFGKGEKFLNAKNRKEALEILKNVVCDMEGTTMMLMLEGRGGVPEDCMTEKDMIRWVDSHVPSGTPKGAVLPPEAKIEIRKYFSRQRRTFPKYSEFQKKTSMWSSGSIFREEPEVDEDEIDDGEPGGIWLPPTEEDRRELEERLNKDAAKHKKRFKVIIEGDGFRAIEIVQPKARNGRPLRVK